jgi:hypothetical protein
MNCDDAKALLTLGPSLSLARASTFEEIVLFSRDRRNFMRLMRCFLPLLPRGTAVHKLRVFWSFAIVTHPQEAFTTYGPLEEALFDASEQMLSVFESILAAVNCGKSTAAVVGFAPLVRTFLRAYEAWEVVEKPRMAKVMVDRLTKLVFARRDTRDAKAFDDRILVHRKRMRRVVGVFGEKQISESMGLDPLLE